MNRDESASGGRPDIHRSSPDARRSVAFVTYRFANVELDEAARRLTVAGRHVKIEPRPMLVLIELLRHVNEVVTKDELLEAVWHRRPTVEGVLANAINKLRKALGSDAGARIQTLPRIGYRLDGPVEAICPTEAVATDSRMLGAGGAVPGRPRFTLLRSLGSHGRANVWLAEQSRTKQERVFKFASDGEELNSLKREYTLLRLLRSELGERPDFSQVLDANFAEPPFFLEFEYGGVDMQTWHDHGDPFARLSLSDRLTLFTKVAQAVADANAVGVIHKDIKPRNILVYRLGEHWQPRVVDFGSASATNAHRLTELGISRIGETLQSGYGAAGATLMYVAPELLGGGKVTMQSDVYSLGVLMFQMLVGDPMRQMASGWQDAISDILLLRIIEAATQGDPGKRTLSTQVLVNQLATLELRRAEELASSLRNAELKAVLEREQLHRARRPWRYATLGSLVLGLVCSLGLAAMQIKARQAASESADVARAVTDFMVLDVLHSADITRAPQEKALSMSDVLNQASSRVEARFQDKPLVEAAIRCQLGLLHQRQGTSWIESTHFRRAISLLEGRVIPTHPDLLTCRYALAAGLAMFYEAKEGEAVLALVDRDVASSGYQLDGKLLNLAHWARLEVLVGLGKYPEAEVVAKQRLSSLERKSASNSLSEVYEAKQRLAEVYVLMDQHATARAIFDELSQPPYDVSAVGAVSMARARVSRAQMYLAQDDFDAGEAQLRSALESMAQAGLANSRQAGQAHFELARVYSHRGDQRAVRQALQSAHGSFSQSLGADHGYTLSIRVNLAITDLLLGDSNQALKALDIVRPMLKVKNLETAGADYYRVIALNELHRHDDALVGIGNIDVDRLGFIQVGKSAAQWQLNAEKGRAMIGLGRISEGRDLLRASIPELEKTEFEKVLLERYKRLLTSS